MASLGHAADWRGGYVGAWAADVSGTSNISTTIDPVSDTYFLSGGRPPVDAAGSAKLNPGGPSGGFEGGYNWQRDRLVYGIDLGIQFDEWKESRAGFGGFGAVTFMLDDTVTSTFLITLLPRIGWTVKDLLFYGTAGAAITRLDHTTYYTDTQRGNEFAESNGLKLGGVVGGGLEYAWTRRWSVRAEFLHVDFGSVTSWGVVSEPLVFTAQMNHSADLRFNVIRAGVDYRF
jgi:outer membrane immunogenic protein